jgi:ligand-binding sensor domain-containing protein
MFMKVGMHDRKHRVLASTRPKGIGLIATCVLAVSLPCHAQNRNLQFRRLTVKDGLSTNWVLSVLRDRRGFLWVGTQSGLNRYDGRAFKTYNYSPDDSGSLPWRVAGVLLEDSRGRIWIGTGWGRRGLAQYDRERDCFIRYSDVPGGLGGHRVNAIVEERQGRLWIGTSNGLYLFDPDQRTYRRRDFAVSKPPAESSEHVLALRRDRRNQLWIGTTAGLYVFDRDLQQCVPWRGFGSGTAGLDRVKVTAITQDDAGMLWVASFNGLYRIDSTKRRITHFLPRPGDLTSVSHRRVQCLTVDGRGRLWIGTENGGVNLYEARSGSFRRFLPDTWDETSISSASIYALHADHQGIVWIGTYNGGLNYVSPFEQAFTRITPRQDGLSDPHVSAILKDRRGDLWIGTDGGGLNRIDARSGRYSYYRHDPENPATLGSDSIFSILEDERGIIWLGGWDGGLSRLDPGSGRVMCYRHDPEDPKTIVGNDVWQIRRLRTGELLVATQQGTDLLDRKTRVFHRLQKLYPESVRDMTFTAEEDRRGNLWLGGPEWIQKIDREAGTVTVLRPDPRNPKLLFSGMVLALYIDSAENVWIGAESGLGYIPASKAKRMHYTTITGLQNDTITNILEDASGSLWVSTSRGISKLINAVRLPRTQKLVNFDVHNGLLGTEFTRGASFRDQDGRLYFGGHRGLNSFRPEEILQNTEAPPVVMTDLKLFNQSVLPGRPGSPLEKAITETSKLTLSYKHAMVTFEFAALNLIIPQKNQYAYKLEGFDESWHYIGTQRSATYTNLPQGAFSLRVRGSNNDGVWNDEGVALNIRVTPPFWKTPWFFTGAALILTVAILALYRLRVRHHLRLERTLQMRIAEAVADIKTLRGLLPICAWCGKVRDDRGYWSQLEEYVSEHTHAEFSHGICPECREKSFQSALPESQSKAEDNPRT